MLLYFGMWDDHAMLEFHHLGRQALIESKVGIRIHAKLVRAWSKRVGDMYMAMGSWWDPYRWLMNLSGNITGGQVAFDALSCKANSSVLLTFRENFDGFLLVLVFLFGEALKIERVHVCNVEIWHYILEGPLVYVEIHISTYGSVWILKWRRLK